VAARPAAVPAPAPTPRHAGRLAGGKLLRFGDAGAAGPRHLPMDTLLMMGVWLALVPTLMLFLSLVSAYVVRSGLAEVWQPVALPPLMWLNTGVLLASSAALEAGRARLRRGAGAGPWIWLAFALGLGFLGGQIVAWRELVAGGLGLGTTPYGSFLYLLSGTHAVHLAAGVLALLTAAVWPLRGWRQVPAVTVARATAVYWHFVDVVWVGLLLLLVLWR
jgi:cytochrome c oxidase subunit 3